jgi:hypothetical protein
MPQNNCVILDETDFRDRFHCPNRPKGIETSNAVPMPVTTKNGRKVRSKKRFILNLLFLTKGRISRKKLAAAPFGTLQQYLPTLPRRKIKHGRGKQGDVSKTQQPPQHGRTGKHQYDEERKHIHVGGLELEDQALVQASAGRSKNVLTLNEAARSASPNFWPK